MASYNSSAKTTEFSGSSTHDSSQFSTHRMRKNVLKFKAYLKTLPKEEQDVISEILHNYRQNRNVYYLVQALKTACDLSKRLTIIPLLKLVIPASDRAAFDQFTCDEVLLKQMTTHHPFNHEITSFETSPINPHNHKQQDGSILCRSIKRVNSSAPGGHLSRSSSLTDLYDHHRLTNGSNHTTTTNKSPNKFGSTLRKKFTSVLNHDKPRSRSKSPTRRKPTHRNHHHQRRYEKKKQQNKNIPSSSVTSGSSRSRDGHVIELIRGKSEDDLGFIIGGGKELGTGIFISHVEVGSVADLAGLKLGDMIVKVNGIQFHSNLPHVEAAKVLKRSKRLLMEVVVGGAKKLMQTSHKSFAWIDASCGEPIAPPSDDETSSRLSGVRSYNSRSGMRLPNVHERKINITIGAGEGLGLRIRGGSEYGIGIYVTGVDEGSVADHAGLMCGDQIVEVNGFRFEGISHAEAVSVIRSSKMLILTVKYTGKIPQEIYRASNNNNKPKTSPYSKKLDVSTSSAASMSSSLDCSALVADLEAMLAPPASSAQDDDSSKLLNDACKYTSGCVDVCQLASSLKHLKSPQPDLSRRVRDLVRSRDLQQFDHILSADDKPADVITSTPPPPPVLSHRAELLAKIKSKKVAPVQSPAKPKRKSLEALLSTDYSVQTEPAVVVTSSPINRDDDDDDVMSESQQQQRQRNNSNNVVRFDKNFRPSQLISPKRKSGGISIGRFKKAVTSKKSLDSIDFTPPAPRPPPPPPTNSDPASCDEQLNNNNNNEDEDEEASSSSNNSSAVEQWQQQSRLSFRSTCYGSSIKTSTPQISPRRDDEQEERDVSNKEATETPMSMTTKQQPQDNDKQQHNKDSDDYGDGGNEVGASIDLQKMVIFRVANQLGLTIEGGAGTEQPLPRIRNIQDGSCAHRCTRLKIGHVIHAVNDQPLEGASHNSAVGAIARAFKNPTRDSLELTVSGPYHKH